MARHVYHTGGLVLLVLMATAACGGETPRTPASAPPGADGPVPVIRLDRVDHKADPLDEWARIRARQHGIPARALRAYGYATVLLAQARPSCHLGWTTLAGIARVESDHGRHGGATVAADGVVRPSIRGVALDGTGGNALIVDASGPAGRTGYARAMGPFQFIPDTWTRWGVRADTDARTLIDRLASSNPLATSDLPGSPDDIDDAALSAGRYLCAAGGDLATAQGWRRAVLAYNHSDAYVDRVRAAAVGYEK
ncbi:murein transglycosylase [Nocardia sp. CDC159]|uniref:Murein transglycosylase n=1 Tax=Nocardia pulmonis TaxID=2951408 RepID=A0A9X2E0H2_9NOCA|nr:MULTISPECIES: murein transglycosylase [Nocardia]MCM6771912.1 murein transglycosylase [Nocardia pulmonis]MCM6785430.1 murein transglycosylase [Nocardia sp. CDC159]